METFGDLNKQSAGFSRILKRLGGTYAVMSAYLSEEDISDKDNSNAHASLRKDVRHSGLGFIELSSVWSEKGKDDSKEFSLFVPNCGRRFAIKLGAKYNQHSILHRKEGSPCENICTSSEKCGSVGKVLETFDKETLSRDDFLGVFSQLKKGRNTNIRFKLSVVQRNAILPIEGFEKHRYSYYEV